MHSKDRDHSYTYEEDYHSQEQREYRKERRRISEKDRSKYKKSDQDQLKKAAITQPPEDGLRGRILAIVPEGMIVECGSHFYRCALKGSLKHDKSRLKNLVAVGDFVRFIPKNDREGTIVFVEERRSILSRSDPLSQKKQQLIAVNIDQVLITVSVILPPLKTFLIDRYIIAARKGNMEPLIVVNKIDLLETPPPQVDATTLEEEKQLYADFLEGYQSIPIFPVSAKTGAGLTALKHAMQNKASVFSGQSGAGKSSLINALIGTALDVGEIVSKTKKGSHTTTMTHLIPIEGGGFCIDTPGIKSFGIWELDKAEIQTHFPEIFHHSQHCRYPDCTHQQEPGCAVLQAVEQGLISRLRFASYSALMAAPENEKGRR